MSGYNNDNIFVISDFDDALENQLLPLTQEISRQAKYVDGRIDMHINSYGGYLHLARHFVDLMELAKRNGVVVRTIVSGVAFSAGSMVSVAGTPGERYIAKDGELMIHYGQAGSLETTPGQVERSSAAKSRSFKQILDHYNRYCDIPNLEGEMLDDGFFIDSRNAVKWKCADKLTSKLTLLT